MLQLGYFSFVLLTNDCKPKFHGSMSVSQQLHTYPFPNLTLTLTCYQLTLMRLGEG